MEKLIEGILSKTDSFIKAKLKYFSLLLITTAFGGALNFSSNCLALGKNSCGQGGT